MRICCNQSKCNILKIYRLLLDILLNFWNLHQILNILKIKMTVVADVFSKLKAVKCIVRQVFKEPRVIATSYRKYV